MQGLRYHSIADSGLLARLQQPTLVRAGNCCSSTMPSQLRGTTMAAVTDICFPLVGERVFLRPLEAVDVPLLWDIENDPDVRRYMGGPLAQLASIKLAYVDNPRDSWITSVSSQCPTYRQLAVCLKQSATFIGSAALLETDYLDKPSVFELAIGIGKSWWNGGNGRDAARVLIDAAFHQMHQCTLEAVADTRNQRSLRILQHFGFEAVGIPTRCRHSDPDGSERYEQRYALLKSSGDG